MFRSKRACDIPRSTLESEELNLLKHGNYTLQMVSDSEQLTKSKNVWAIQILLHKS